MTIEHTLHIEAPPEVVWAVTADVERWPEWTPTITAVRRVDERPFGLGSVVRIKQPGQPASEWTGTEFVPEQPILHPAKGSAILKRSAVSAPGCSILI